MKRYAHLIAITICLLFATSIRADMPPGPGMTNGDGNPANNGMKHATVELSETTLSVHVGDPPATPVTMVSGNGADYTPDKFDVLEDAFFNAQHGWLPGGILSPPEGGAIWIKRTAATQPPGATFRVYEGGNMMEGMAAWTMDEIYGSDGDVWQWDGAMQHDYFTGDRVGDYSMSFEVYVGDSAGAPLDGYAPGSATLSFRAVPEPEALCLAAVGALGFLFGARRRGARLRTR